MRCSIHWTKSFLSAYIDQILSDASTNLPALSKSLNVVSGSLDISQLFCCSDQLTHPSTFWDVGQSTLLRLEDWWRNVWKGWCPQSHLDEDVYLEVLGRFLGPASSVRIHCPVAPRLEVRTAGEAVSELGRRLSLLVLTPRQLDLLDKARPRVCVSGPPGTGKTVVVTVMGLKWLLEGNDVHVVSTRPASLAASRVVFHQLRLTRLTYSSHELGAVFFHHFDFYCQRQVQAAVEVLTAAATARGGQLHVLMEEAVFSDSGSVLGPHYLHFIHVLLARVPALHLWVARVRHDKIPDVLEKEILTTPLRSAPAVLREVRPGVEQNAVHNYSDDLGVAAPSDGPQVMRLSHDGPAHSGVWPHNCPHCGLLLAQLFRHLHVGSSARMKPSRNSPDPLRYKDVFILTRSSDLQDDVTTHDASGLVTSPASGLVRGLREEGVPVRVLEESPPCEEGDKWRRAVEDTAEAGMDTVTVAHWRPVLGLERKLVVWLKGRAVKDDKNRDDVEVEMWDRLWVVSRCTTQLVVVDVPP